MNDMSGITHRHSQRPAAPPRPTRTQASLVVLVAVYVCLVIIAAASAIVLHRPVASGQPPVMGDLLAVANSLERSAITLVAADDGQSPGSVAAALATISDNVATLRDRLSDNPAFAGVIDTAATLPALAAEIADDIAALDAGRYVPRPALKAKLRLIASRTGGIEQMIEQSAVAAERGRNAEAARFYRIFVTLVGLMSVLIGLIAYKLVRQLRETTDARGQLQVLTEELRTAAHDAEAGNRAKSAFLATMSHEIRTPINGILGMADLLSDARLDPAEKTLVDDIQNCGRGLVAIINDILDFSKLESGGFEFERIPFCPVETAESAVAIIEPALREKGLTLVLAPELAYGRRFVGDQARIRQVIVNFLSNAVKFTETGTIVVRLQERRGGEGRSWMRVEVEDTGVGIPPEGHSRLFKEFSQGDASITRRFGGTGLGLAICRRIIEGLDGTIGATSEEGQGSLFYFEVPVGRESLSDTDGGPLAGLSFSVSGRTALETDALVRLLDYLGAHRAPPMTSIDVSIGCRLLPPDLTRADCLVAFSRADGSHERRLNACLPGRIVAGFARKEVADATQPRHAPRTRRRILVVEDNRINREVMVRMLSRLGQDVTFAEDGAEALVKASTRDFELIFMDMQMPVMDGLEATRAIRRSGERGRDVPIYALTANIFATDRDACLAAGMDGFLVKPIERRALATVLDDLDGGHGRRRSPSSRPARESDGSANGIDARRIAALVSELGPEDADFLIQGFLDEAPRLLVAFSDALGAGDVALAGRSLHSLKGAAANVGFTGIATLAATLMGGLPSPDAAGLGQLMVAIASAETAVAALRRREPELFGAAA